LKLLKSRLTRLFGYTLNSDFITDITGRSNGQIRTSVSCTPSSALATQQKTFTVIQFWFLDDAIQVCLLSRIGTVVAADVGSTEEHDPTGANDW